MPSLLIQVGLLLLSYVWLGFGVWQNWASEPLKFAQKALWEELFEEVGAPFVEFQQLKNQILWGKLAPAQARRQVKKLRRTLQQLARKLGCTGGQRPGVFPVAGYGLDAIGGTKGEGYIPGPFSYFDGNLAKGHPAQDIFIVDRDFDYRDDRTGALVAIQSFSGGIVVARNTQWDEGDPLRGGVYVDVYDPQTRQIFYYAHLASLEPEIQPGTCVSPGTRLGYLGRSGKNAYPRRSPTHLHFAVYQVARTGLIRPVNPYPLLAKSRISK